MRCIYCPCEANSEEDWFPLWLGNYKGIGVLRDRLCRGCNTHLGRTVDQVMSKQSPEAVNRFALRIPNRDGKPPDDPFQYKGQVAPPLTLRSDPEGIDFDPILTLDGPEVAPWSQQIVLRRDGLPPVAIALKKDFASWWLRDAIAKRDLVGARVIAIAWAHTGSDDEARPPDPVLGAIRDAIPGFEKDLADFGVAYYAIDRRGKPLNKRARLSMVLPGEYARALAK